MALGKRITSFILDILQTVVLALAIFMIVYLFLFQPHQVKGQSMDPNFEDGEYLLTDKISYKVGAPKRGNVIIFAAPPNERDDFIKRIVGLPGETVSLQDGKILINGEPLIEPYIPTNIETFPGAYLAEGEQVSLGPDDYFVLGDNRSHSSDSRAWGPIKKEHIVGKAWLVYWPPDSVRVIPGISNASF